MLNVDALRVGRLCQEAKGIIPVTTQHRSVQKFTARPVASLLSALVVISGCLLTSGESFAQSTAIPATLTGRWSLPGSRDTQRVIVNFEAGRRSGTLSLTFADERCSLRSVPVGVALLGDRVTLRPADGFAAPCVTDFALEMVPNRDARGEMGYLGELRLAGSAASRAPILRGRLAAP